MMKIIIGKISNDFGQSGQDAILFINNISSFCLPINKIEDKYYFVADANDDDFERLGEYINAKKNVRP